MGNHSNFMFFIEGKVSVQTKFISCWDICTFNCIWKSKCGKVLTRTWSTKVSGFHACPVPLKTFSHFDLHIKLPMAEWADIAAEMYCACTPACLRDTNKVTFWNPNAEILPGLVHVHVAKIVSLDHWAFWAFKNHSAVQCSTRRIAIWRKYRP